MNGATGGLIDLTPKNNKRPDRNEGKADRIIPGSSAHRDRDREAREDEKRNHPQGPT
jgi:hypothetical protein